MNSGITYLRTRRELSVIGLDSVSHRSGQCPTVSDQKLGVVCFDPAVVELICFVCEGDIGFVCWDAYNSTDSNKCKVWT